MKKLLILAAVTALAAPTIVSPAFASVNIDYPPDQGFSKPSLRNARSPMTWIDLLAALGVVILIETGASILSVEIHEIRKRRRR